MKAVIQRVKSAKVTIAGEITGKIGHGILVLVAVHETDTLKTIEWFANKLINLRIFEDENGKMNLSLHDVAGEMLVVSNFTIYGETAKGLRPSYSNSASPDLAEPLYNTLIDYLKLHYDKPVQTGKFGAMMDVELVNDGPVTLIIEK